MQSLMEKRITKTVRIEAIILINLVPISKAEICNIVPDVSSTIVEAVLSKGTNQKDRSIRKPHGRIRFSIKKNQDNFCNYRRQKIIPICVRF